MMGAGREASLRIPSGDTVMKKCSGVGGASRQRLAGLLQGGWSEMGGTEMGG